MKTIEEKILCSQQNCFEDDHFNSVLQSGGISHVAYDGLSIEQNPNVIYPLYHLIKTINPSQILEIGTFAGGLTLMIRDILDHLSLNDCDLITYDVNFPFFLKEKINGKKINILVKNLFSENYSDFKSNLEKNEIYDYINNSGRTIVFCDGGSKKNEFNLISSLLKPGDIIMAHDYSYDEEIFKKEILNKYWNWKEIDNSDIIESCKKYNLEDFMMSEFKTVAWVCKIKNN